METENAELSNLIIGAAMKVLYALKPGLAEKLYERALIIELRKQGIKCEPQKRFNVYYEQQHIGILIPDLIVGELFIVDTKVLSAFNETHIAQMLGYLTITGLTTALLLNFKNAKIGIKRVTRFETL